MIDCSNWEDMLHMARLIPSDLFSSAFVLNNHSHVCYGQVMWYTASPIKAGFTTVSGTLRLGKQLLDSLGIAIPFDIIAPCMLFQTIELNAL
jgi:hypothetical protein